MSGKRPYDMTTRQHSVKETRRRILAATVELSFEKRSLEIVLSDVAERSAVSVQSILRHFHSREQLFDAAAEFAQSTIIEERIVSATELPRAIGILIDHYELRGDAVLRFLGQEFWDERIRRVMDEGRRIHREWIASVFASQLGERDADRRDELIDLLVVATDVYAWKLLRRDRLLSREKTEQRMRVLTGILLGETSKG